VIVHIGRYRPAFTKVCYGPIRVETVPASVGYRKAETYRVTLWAVTPYC
jgi:hypothetical protein